MSETFHSPLREAPQPLVATHSHRAPYPPSFAPQQTCCHRASSPYVWCTPSYPTRHAQKTCLECPVIATHHKRTACAPCHRCGPRCVRIAHQQSNRTGRQMVATGDHGSNQEGPRGNKNRCPSFFPLPRSGWGATTDLLFDDLDVDAHTTAWKVFDTVVIFMPKVKLELLVSGLSKGRAPQDGRCLGRVFPRAWYLLCLSLSHVLPREAT